MTPEILQTARRLVDHHKQVDPGLLKVRLYDDPSNHEVRLLEVVDGSPDAGEILPFRFSPDPENDVLFPVVIIELSPSEFERAERGELHLPAGWRDDTREDLL